MSTNRYTPGCIFFTLLFSIAHFIISGQNSCIQQAGALYGSPNLNERGKCLIASPDQQGLYAIGMIEDSVVIARLDLHGAISWARTIDVVPDKTDHVSTAIIDNEGMLVIVGIAGDYQNGGSVFALRFDPVNSQVVWAKSYTNHTGRTYTFAVLQNPVSENYIVCTNPHVPLPGTINDDELIEIDRNTGDILLAKTKDFDLGGSDQMSELVCFQDFIYATGRYSDGLPNNRMRNTILKIDPVTFEQKWVKVGHVSETASARLYGKDLIVEEDGIYSMSHGDPAGTSSTLTELYVQKMDLEGHIIWMKKYDLPGRNDVAHQMIKSGNGFIVLAGENGDEKRIDFFKIDRSGEVIWARQIQLPNEVNAQFIDRGNAQIVEIEDQLFITGTASYSTGSTDIFILRTDLEGNASLPCGGTIPLSVASQDISNPIFYDVSPMPYHTDYEQMNGSLASFSTPLTPQQECIVSDTLKTTIEATICQGGSLEGYISSGTYEDYFKTLNGCDSLRTLVLIVDVCDSSGCNTITGAVYGTSTGNEYGYSLAATPEKDGFYVSGHREDSALLVKMNLLGEVIWSRTFDIIPGEVEHVGTLIVDRDGMVAMAGTAGDPDVGGTIFACRYNPMIDQVLWAREYITDLTNERCFALLQRENNDNYILSSNPNDVPQSNNDASLIELDLLTGNVVPSFSHQYHLGSSEVINEIILHGQALYGAGRYTDGSSTAQMRNTLVKIDLTTGHHDWVRLGHVPVNASGRLYGFDLTIIQNAIYSGYHGDDSGTSTTNTKLFLQKTDLEGNLIWLKQYDLPGTTDFGFEVIESDNGLVVLAENRTTPRQLYLFKTNLQGDVLWAKAYRFPKAVDSDAYYYGQNQLITIGNQLLFTGYGLSTENGYEMLVCRTDLDGNVLSPCVEAEDVEINVTPVANPMLYSVDVEETMASHESIAYQTNTIPSAIRPEEQCIVVDTLFTFLEVAICEGQQFEGYTTSGIYEDYFTSALGCDSLRTLSLKVLACDALVYYSLNACSSFMSNGSNMDYSEFIPEYPTTTGCAEINATNLFRSPPQENKHSCTPGVNSSIGMCISGLATCSYLPGHQASLVSETDIVPTGDSVVQLTKLEFYERSPAMYSWIGGGSGPNNYPRFYGLRILKNGIEIYRQENIATHLDWTGQTFDFTGIEAFRIDEPANLRIEILPYCPIGNGALVSAWDIDEVNLFGGCLPAAGNFSTVSGVVKTESGKEVPSVTITTGKHASFIPAQQTITDSKGQYAIDSLDLGWKYHIKAAKTDNCLDGVNTLDLIRIQKHLLGLESFVSLTQYIAADVNRDATIDVRDVLELRKTLLGIYTAFPNSPSWIIGNARDIAFSSDHPFGKPNILPPAIAPLMNFDFLGIKIGDVNGDVNPGANQNQLDVRDSDSFPIYIDDAAGERGHEVLIPFLAGDNISLEGIQLMLNSKELLLIDIERGRIPLAIEHFSCTPQGDIRLSWSQVEPVRVTKGDILFTLKCLSQANVPLSHTLNLRHAILHPEVYSMGNAKPIHLVFINSKEEMADQRFRQISIEPNPFSSSTTIRFDMIQSGMVRFVFFNPAGQKLYEVNQIYAAGMQTLEIRDQEIAKGPGLIYCQMTSDSQMTVQKLIRIE